MPERIDWEPAVNRSVKTTSPDRPAAQPKTALTVETLLLEPGDGIPNNPDLPVLLYREACAEGAETAQEFERLFRQAGWQGVWRNGIFDYHHYHTQGHEVLGIAEGRAQLMIGGPSGREISVRAGDCLVLPAGTGHKRIDASRDFLVIGAYPPGQTADIQTEAATQEQLKAIAELDLPPSDPIEGKDGSLLRLWRTRR
jgi:uncharacterized protein YjlB